MRLGIAVPERHVKKDILDAALEATTRLDHHMIAAGSPTFKEAGHRVVWRPEPPGQEHFDHVNLGLQRGWMDCDDLAPWHAASLRYTGEDPRAYAEVLKSGPKSWHAIVRRGNGKIDDPSKWRGMGRRRGRGISGGSILPLLEMASNVGAFSMHPRVALTELPSGIWEARADLPYNYIPWSRNAPGMDPEDVAMATLHRSPVASQAIVGACMGACELGESNGYMDDNGLEFLEAVAWMMDGASYEEVVDRFGEDIAQAAYHSNVGFIKKALKGLGKGASKAVKTVTKPIGKGIKTVTKPIGKGLKTVTKPIGKGLKKATKPLGKGITKVVTSKAFNLVGPASLPANAFIIAKAAVSAAQAGKKKDANFGDVMRGFGAGYFGGGAAYLNNPGVKVVAGIFGMKGLATAMQKGALTTEQLIRDPESVKKNPQVAIEAAKAAGKAAADEYGGEIGEYASKVDLDTPQATAAINSPAIRGAAADAWKKNPKIREAANEALRKASPEVKKRLGDSTKDALNAVRKNGLANSTKKMSSLAKSMQATVDLIKEAELEKEDEKRRRKPKKSEEKRILNGVRNALELVRMSSEKTAKQIERQAGLPPREVMSAPPPKKRRKKKKRKRSKTKAVRVLQRVGPGLVCERVR